MYMHIDNETAGFILAHSLKLTSSCISKLCDLAQFNLSDGELSAHTRVWTDRQNSPPKTTMCHASCRPLFLCVTVPPTWFGRSSQD